MGNTLQVMSEDKLPHDPFFYRVGRIEEAECFHFHWRDLRILMTSEQFASFCQAVLKCANHDIAYNGEDLLLTDFDIPGDPFFGREVKIEEVEGGVYHFHYNDIRLELDKTNFIKLCNAFVQARMNCVFNTKKVLVPMHLIDPYDHIHKALPNEWPSQEEYDKHMEGARIFAECIKKGYQIRPIVLTPNGTFYKRRDGFKRYMAYHILGYANIPSWIVTEEEALTCPQHGVYPFIQEGAFDVKI